MATVYRNARAELESGSTGLPSTRRGFSVYLANDWLGGTPATTATVDFIQVSSTHPGVTLDVSSRSVNVAGAQAGFTGSCIRSASIRTLPIAVRLPRRLPSNP